MAQDETSGPRQMGLLETLGISETSRFRLTPTVLTADQQKLRQQLYADAIRLENTINRIKSGRYRSLAYTQLELAIKLAEMEISS